jgi:hypothetical protein
LFSSIIRSGGKGYITFNAARMVEQSSQQLLTDIGLNAQLSTLNKNESLANYIVNEIDKIKLKLLIVDVLIQQQSDEALDGNIRIVFEK